jgi:hypothetical protein
MRSASPIGGLAGTAGLVAVSLVPLAAAGDLPDSRSGTVAAVFGPLAAPADTVRAVAGTGGRIVGAGGWANVILVTASEPGFAGRLRAAGAWLVLDPGGFAGCTPRTSG